MHLVFGQPTRDDDYPEALGERVLAIVPEVRIRSCEDCLRAACLIPEGFIADAPWANRHSEVLDCSNLINELSFQVLVEQEGNLALWATHPLEFAYEAIPICVPFALLS